tara:strand:- start:8773 stop:8904 length:132 start_codon:yes stop_codon:yes gene_type:complete
MIIQEKVVLVYVLKLIKKLAGILNNKTFNIILDLQQKTGQLVE